MKLLLFVLLSLIASACFSESVTADERINRDEDLRVELVLEHFWDGFPFNQAGIYQDPSTLGGLKKYLNLVFTLPRENRWKAIAVFLQLISVNSEGHHFFCQRIYEALSTPNSIFRSDDLAMELITYRLEKGIYKPGEKESDKSMLALLGRNRPGKEAEDFEFTTDKGEKSRLYQIDANYTLIYFYNPQCETCHQSTARLQELEVEHYLKGLDVTVLAVLVDSDEPLAEQKQLMGQDWMIATEGFRRIESGQLYDLRAIPSLVLLDNNKRVILKDATMEQVVDFFYKKEGSLLIDN